MNSKNLKKIDTLIKKINLFKDDESYTESVMQDLCSVYECRGRILAGGKLSLEIKENLNGLWKVYNSRTQRIIHDIIKHMRKNEKIQGIKLIRALLSLGLKDSKELYEYITETFISDESKRNHLISLMK